MFIFKSNKERYFWTLVAMTQIAIWASLGFAGKLVQKFEGTHILTLAFVVGFLVMITVIVSGVFSRKPTGKEIWVLTGITTVYAMIVVRMGVPTLERTHLFEYALVAVLVFHAFLERYSNKPNMIKVALFSIILTGLLGWIDEEIQRILPNRVYDIRDILFNILAGVMTVTACSLLTWKRLKNELVTHNKQNKI